MVLIDVDGVILIVCFVIRLVYFNWLNVCV